MTAINVIQTHDAIHFFSDGAFIDPRSGKMVTIGQKVFAFPHARCAIGISGPMELCRHLGMVGQSCVTIDQVITDVEALLPKMIEILLQGERHFGVYVGGFSPDGERQFFKLNAKTTDRTFKFIRCDAGCWSYSPTLTRHSIALALGEDNADEFDRGFIERLAVADPFAHGMLALEAQRRIKVSDASLAGGSAYTVGAFAQATSVYADRVESRILKQWPYQCGATIAADGAAKVHQFGFGNISYQPRELVGFKSSGGINSGSSSNYTVDTTNGLVKPTTAAGSDVSPTMTSNTAPSPYVISASAEDTSANNGPAWKASDDSTGVGGWRAATGAGSWWKIDFGSSESIGSYNITSRTDAAGNQPTAWTLQGSDTGSFSGEQTTVDTQSGVSWSGTAETKTFTLGSTATYRYYRFLFSAVNGGGAITVGEFRFFGPVTANNMTVVTTAQTADSPSDHARVLLEIDDTANITLGTDLTVEVTTNGGTNWHAAAFATGKLTGQSGRKVIETVDQACTAGTSIAVRVKTFNKNIPIHGLALTWRG